MLIAIWLWCLYDVWRKLYYCLNLSTEYSKNLLQYFYFSCSKQRQIYLAGEIIQWYLTLDKTRQATKTIAVLWVVKSHQPLGKRRREREEERERDGLQQPEQRSQTRGADTSGLRFWDLHELLQTARQYSSESKLFLLPPQPPNKKGAQRPLSGTKYQRTSMAWHGPETARAQHTADIHTHRQQHGNAK